MTQPSFMTNSFRVHVYQKLMIITWYWFKRMIWLCQRKIYQRRYLSIILLNKFCILSLVLLLSSQYSDDIVTGIMNFLYVSLYWEKQQDSMCVCLRWNVRAVKLFTSNEEFPVVTLIFAEKLVLLRRKYNKLHFFIVNVSTLSSIQDWISTMWLIYICASWAHS